MSPCKIATLALIAPAVVAATIALPATAHASNSYQFQSPSGNVGCEMWEEDGTFSVVCQLHDHTWAAPPPSGDCQYGGYDLKLLRGGMPCAGVWPGVKSGYYSSRTSYRRWPMAKRTRLARSPAIASHRV
jgi:hypothetical protein